MVALVRSFMSLESIWCLGLHSWTGLSGTTGFASRMTSCLLWDGGAGIACEQRSPHEPFCKVAWPSLQHVGWLFQGKCPKTEQGRRHWPVTA